MLKEKASYPKIHSQILHGKRWNKGHFVAEDISSFHPAIPLRARHQSVDNFQLYPCSNLENDHPHPLQSHRRRHPQIDPPAPPIHMAVTPLILGKQLELKKILPEPSLCGGDVIFIKATVVILPTCFLTSAAAFFFVRSIWIQIHPTKWRCNMHVWLEGKPYSTFKIKHWKPQEWGLVDDFSFQWWCTGSMWVFGCCITPKIIGFKVNLGDGRFFSGNSTLRWSRKKNDISRLCKRKCQAA